MCTEKVRDRTPKVQADDEGERERRGSGQNLARGM